MSLKDRFNFARKAFINFRNFRNYDENFERRDLTVLSDIFFGKTTLRKVLQKGYMTNTYVYAIINQIAKSASEIPIIAERRLPDGTWEEILEGDAISGDFYNFVHRPNPNTNYKSFMYEAIVYQLSTGNVFEYGINPVGFPHFSERYTLRPQYMNPKIKVEITGPVATSYKYEVGNKIFDLEPEEVMHLALFNPDPERHKNTSVMGLSPLEVAWRTLVSSNESITASASLIKNKGAFGMLTAKGERPLKKEEKDAVNESLRQDIGGGENYGGIKTTSGSFDFIKLAMSPSDLKLIEMNVLTLRDLCSVYGVSSRMFNDPNGTTFNNSKEDGKKFYAHGVLPPAENENDHFNMFFVPGWNERDGQTYRTRLDVSEIDALQEDQAKLMVKARTRSEVVRQIITGITEKKWDRDSAIKQLMDALNVEEDYASELIGEIPEEIIPEDLPQPNPIPNEEE